MTIQFGSTIRFGIRVSRSPELGGDVTYPLNPRFKPIHIEKLYDVLHTSQRFVQAPSLQRSARTRSRPGVVLMAGARGS